MLLQLAENVPEMASDAVNELSNLTEKWSLEPRTTVFNGKGIVCVPENVALVGEVNALPTTNPGFVVTIGFEKNNWLPMYGGVVFGKFPVMSKLTLVCVSVKLEIVMAASALQDSRVTSEATMIGAIVFVFMVLMW